MSADLDRVVIRLGGVLIDAVALDRPVLTIGRAADTDLTLAHPCISRHHAEIRRQADVTTIVDLGSVNGVIVAGEHIPANQPLPVAPGTVAEFGPYSLTFLTPAGADQSSAALTDTTVETMRAELRIHIDKRDREGDVAEITETEFFRRLREQQERLRRQEPHLAERAVTVAKVHDR